METKQVRWTQNKKNQLSRAFRKNLRMEEIAKLFNTTIAAVTSQKYLMVKSGELKIKPKETGYKWLLDKVTDAVPKSELRKSPNRYHFKKYPGMVEKIQKRRSRKSKINNSDFWRNTPIPEPKFAKKINSESLRKSSYEKQRTRINDYFNQSYNRPVRVDKALDTLAAGFELIAESLRDILK